MRMIQASAVLVLIVFWSGAGADCDPPSSAQLLNFDAYAQQTDTWCWAASGQMTMNHVDKDSVPSQCAAVNKRWNRNDCCTTPGNCLFTSDLPPLYEAYGFEYEATSDDLELPPADRALPWEEIKEQIYCKKKPFAFSWWSKASMYTSGHVMVAIGYKETGGKRFVTYIDPYPVVDSDGPIPHDGRLVTVTYATYIKRRSGPEAHIHGTAYYDISKK